MTRSPPAARGVRVRVPSCAWVMLLTIAKPRPTPAWSVRMRLLPRRNGSASVATYLRGDLVAGVLDGEHRSLGVSAGRDPHGSLFGQVVDDRVVHEVRSQLQQERVRADGGGHVAGGLDGDAALLCEGEERLGGFFRYEGQVDVFSREGPLVGAAEQEQCFGEVDRPGVDGVEAVDELAVVAVRIVARDLEKRLRDRQRGAQLVGGVGRESLLLGDVLFQPREHGVEAVGELAELVAAAR